MIRRPPRSTRMTHSFPTRRSSDLSGVVPHSFICVTPVLMHRSTNGSTIERISGRTIHLRSEEHTSELQSLMRTSYAVFCLNTKTTPYTPITSSVLSSNMHSNHVNKSKSTTTKYKRQT